MSPAEKNVDETLSTLKFAQRAKLMLNTAVVNEDMFGNPAVMGEEIRRLRLEIAFLRGETHSLSFDVRQRTFVTSVSHIERVLCCLQLVLEVQRLRISSLCHLKKFNLVSDKEKKILSNASSANLG